MSDERPNILWICTDQQRYDTLGCYGNDFVETPNLDRLADSGVRFDNAYCQSPICAPSRGSFMTGRYPRTCRLRQNGQSIPEEELPVTRLFADEGYVCGNSGKLHLGRCFPEPDSDTPLMEHRIDDGYGPFHWSHSPAPNWVTNEYQHWLNERGVEYATPDVAVSEYVNYAPEAEHHHTTWCAQQAINFIEQAAGEDVPWLWTVNMFDPHQSFDAPKGYLERYLNDLSSIPLPEYEPGELEDKPAFHEKCHVSAYNKDDPFYPYVEMDKQDHRAIRAAYWAMVDLIDEQVGRMLDALERTGQRENTIVIFMSDHGELLGAHGIYLKGPFFYEESVNVPLIIEGPDIEGGRTTDALVELTDIAPTLLNAAGIDIHPGIQGESAWPLLAGQRAEHRDLVYSESYNAERYMDSPEPYVTMVRDEHYKLIKVHGRDEGELYDLAKDSSETRNRWHDERYQSVKYEMMEKLSDAMAWTADPLPEREAKF